MDWCTGDAIILENPLIIFEFQNDWQTIIVKDVHALSRVNISFYFCDWTNLVFTNTSQNIRHTGAAVTTSIQS